MRIVFSYFLIVKLLSERTYLLKLIPFSVCDYFLDNILADFVRIREFHLATDVIALHISIRIRGNLYVVGFLQDSENMIDFSQFNRDSGIRQSYDSSEAIIKIPIATGADIKMPLTIGICRVQVNSRIHHIKAVIR